MPPNTRLVGVCAFSSTLRGLELVPSKWRYLIPGEHWDGAQSRRIEPVEITSPHQGATQTPTVGRLIFIGAHYA